MHFISKYSQPLLRALKFGSVGLSGVVVNMGILYILTETAQINYKLSALIAIELSIVNNFIWNSIWTWSDKKISSKRKVSKRFLKFQLSSSLTAFVVNYGLLLALTELFFIHYQISNLIGIAFGSLFNFLLSHFWVFKHKTVTNVPS